MNIWSGNLRKIRVTESKKDFLNLKEVLYDLINRISFAIYYKDEENKIDGHKICACITGAMLNVRIINYEMPDEDNRLILFSTLSLVFFNLKL